LLKVCNKDAAIKAKVVWAYAVQGTRRCCPH
jgi:hypothetical protein